jgi:[acyl-carrier-protein] S-malonyltransferase
MTENAGLVPFRQAAWDAAAWVGERAIPAAVIDERVAALQAGPYAARLPHPSTMEGRNLRRWVTQAVVTEAVVSHEASLRNLIAIGSPEPVTRASALRTGGVVAAVLAAHPLARVLRDAVTGDVAVAPEAAADYHRRNRDRHPGDFAAERDRIVATLLSQARERYFAHWLDERCAALVRLAPGYEHPADPAQPDYVHHH